MKPYGFIYITTNNINNKKYIGQRKIMNRPDDRSYLGSGAILREAIKKHGRENFSREIIEYAYSKEELDRMEKDLIREMNAINSRDFYNIATGGDGGDTTSGWSEERARTHSKRIKELGIYAKENNGFYNKKHSAETRRRLSEIAKQRTTNGFQGKKHSAETIQKIINNRKLPKGEDHYMYGKRGENAINGKKVYKYLDPEHLILVDEFPSLKMAVEGLGLKGHTTLLNAIRDNKQYKGYYWSRTKTCND